MEKQRDKISGLLSANTISAFAALSKRAYEASCEWINPNPAWLGTYIIPAKKGVLYCVVEEFSLTIFHDKTARIDTACQVHFPLPMLENCKRRYKNLINEGDYVKTLIRPAPDKVFLNEGFAMVCAEIRNKRDEKDYQGVFGTWFTPHDDDRWMDSRNFHIRKANAAFISKMLNSAKNEISLDKPQGAMNFYIFNEIFKVAEKLEIAPLTQRFSKNMHMFYAKNFLTISSWNQRKNQFPLARFINEIVADGSEIVDDVLEHEFITVD